MCCASCFDKESSLDFCLCFPTLVSTKFISGSIKKQTNNPIPLSLFSSHWQLSLLSSHFSTFFSQGKCHSAMPHRIWGGHVNLDVVSHFPAGADSLLSAPSNCSVLRNQLGIKMEGTTPFTDDALPQRLRPATNTICTFS